jgi:L-2-hydroxyglutarate oxidase LhgO
LIYPVPVPGGLGVHLTVDLGGQARFGPDVEWVDEIEYTVDPRRADSFYEAVRRYWPDLKDGGLQPGYSGIRPKTVPQGAPGQDFVIQGSRTHGINGLVNLFGIESPGLTSAIALADYVRETVFG